MLTADELRGCYPAIITPMTPGSPRARLDTEAVERLIVQVLDAGVSGIVIAGTTGQSATLSHDEHVALVRESTHVARRWSDEHGREVHVIASAGSNATHEAVTLCERILKWGGVDAVLQVTGYYNNPPQEGLLKHFQQVADAAAQYDASTVLYNVPSRTRSNIEAGTCVELAAHPAIIGVKEASGDLDQVQAILDGTREVDFNVVSGEDHLVAEIIRRGGTGVISASANVWPREFQVLCDLGLAGRHDDAAELQKALMPCVEAVFSAKNPIPLHHILGSALRLPLVGVDELREPGRGKVLAAIERAIGIREFPHAGLHTRMNLRG